ncbi:MAG: Wadjet anti-phage system protein JetD domain-containing protein [bacterium]
MDYGKEILNKLIEMYERREGYAKAASALRAIQLDVTKEYPAYIDRYNHEAYRNINAAIEQLIGDRFVSAALNNSGQYQKVKLNVDRLSDCYKKLKRVSIPQQCDRIMEALQLFADSKTILLQNVAAYFQSLIKEYKKLPYELKYDGRRVAEVLSVLEAVLQLDKETYIRNFSTALFKDSKRFQKEFSSVIKNILFDYTDSVIEKERILEFYNLYENPTYVLIKGNAQIVFAASVINVIEMPDGIALSNASLAAIRNITVNSCQIITVENLTAYHDSDEQDAVHIYLGGYHNNSKQRLLERIYANNKQCRYLHKGDLDVYGFLILENLKAKTKIPFESLMMDVPTLKRFYKAGLYKALTAHDIKIIKDKKETQLALYADVLDFMLAKNCKVEQESIKAVELLE